MQQSPLRTLVLALTLLLGVTTAAWASNESNQDEGGPHVAQLDSESGTVTLEFHAGGAACVSFELRLDGVVVPSKDVGYAAACNYRDVQVGTFTAHTVSVRLHVQTPRGAAPSPWNFDWTDFTSAPEQPTTTDDCKDGGWESYGFANQGQCIKFVTTGKDSRS